MLLYNKKPAIGDKRQQPKNKAKVFASEPVSLSACWLASLPASKERKNK